MARVNSGIGCSATSAAEAAGYGAPLSVSSASRTDEKPAPPGTAPSSPSSHDGNACATFIEAVCPSADSVANSQLVPYIEFACCSNYSSTATLCGGMMRLMRSGKVY
ncbi:hypothetical protein LDHU3_14.0300:CDS1 [Leishmania donovani]|nr:hypothetical protein CGC20_38840 [Leishmania donovani]CAJ1987287.1 hypothetical protein LDHU3_14.0300:CDS1 [Leishmania donovani]VDZ43176.1 hypothetical_protein [Leishmania donovani]